MTARKYHARNSFGSPNEWVVDMFRFTIRDVLWLMVVVGMAVAWFLTWQRLTVQRVRIEQYAKNLEIRTALDLENRLGNERRRLSLERVELEKKLEAAQRQTKFELHYPIYFPPSPDDNEN